MKPTMYRLVVVSLALLMSVFALPLSLTTAQEATPGTSLLEGLGLPVLEVTVTSEGIEVPSDVAAGPVLLTVHNDTEGFQFVDLVQLPDGVSVEEYAVASSSEGALPEWAADVVIIGGVGIPPSLSGSVAMNPTAGDVTVVAAGENMIAEPAATLTVTGEADAAAVDAVAADLAVDMGHYTFDIPDTVPAGDQVWKVTNSHDGMLHHLIVVQTDRLYTAEEVQEGIIGDFSGTPVPDGFSLFSIPEEQADAVASPVISARQSVWVEAILEPGFYVAICFIPDPSGDVPHVMMGMIDTFEATAP